jgi:nucleoid-associated protein YgaU
VYRLGIKNSYTIAKKNQDRKKSQKNKFFELNMITKWLFIIIPLTIMIIFLLVWVSLGNSSIKYIKIEVEKGQSLWNIARNNYGQEYDLRSVIYRIKKINKLKNVVLHPGQELILPIQ